MNENAATPEDAIASMVNAYGDTLYRICLFRLGRVEDAQDAVQETFLRLLKHPRVFETPEHEKAWLIRVALNVCRDMGRWRTRHPETPIENAGELSVPEEDSGILEALYALPEKYRTALLLHYAEGYTTKEIASIIGKSASAVKMRLQKGRELLKDAYEKEEQS